MSRKYSRRVKKKKNYFSKILLLLLFVVVIGYFKYRGDIYKPVNEDNIVDVSFQIEEGTSVKGIAANLKEQGLIRSESSFYYYVKFNDLGQKFLAGRFLLNQGMDVPEIIETLGNQSVSESVITIQEGLMIRDIDQKLVDLGLIEPGEFNQAVKNFDSWGDYVFLSQNLQQNLEFPLEGYIYPDTYFLDSNNFHPDDLIELGLDNFKRKTADLVNSKSEYTLHEIITMASIVENEVFGSEDRKIVAGLLWKRLENGWTIGADVTLVYVTDDRMITAADLDLDSPYNTRKFQGLPPGPISNPSVDSINATMNPQSTEFWFYLTTLDTGEVIYSSTNEEHNLNKVKYL